MKLEEYKEKYHYAPFREIEFARAAAKVEDDDELRRKAEQYIRSKEEFHDALQEREIFYG